MMRSEDGDECADDAATVVGSCEQLVGDEAATSRKMTTTTDETSSGVQMKGFEDTNTELV